MNWKEVLALAFVWFSGAIVACVLVLFVGCARNEPPEGAVRGVRLVNEYLNHKGYTPSRFVSEKGKAALEDVAAAGAFMQDSHACVFVFDSRLENDYDVIVRSEWCREFSTTARVR